ncbi:FecR family protein [Sphingobium cloacae]|uniref:Anti-FecI sigma factor FecR n=1 Tax=Sphingobium cloacae TaxID=120107 RepID=A0A1E1F0A0_9SPHN|nr:FecR family protein [Sphingobium cloacae]BAV63937.1 anti-FecI sigma factor FecR [Sphingobium cloacae]
MPADQPIPKDIADEAARWFADRDNGLLGDESGLRAWLAADPRHARAFAEMEAVWSDLGGVKPSPAVRASIPSPPVRAHGNDNHRTRRAWVSTAVAASVALVAIGLVDDWPMRLRADAVTATGERRTIAMPDGSSVVLNTHSAVAFDYRNDRRIVRLLRGEAAFTVAPDRSRPFTVEANGGSSTALGTRFVIREDGNDTRVAVTEHVVRVAYARGGSSAIGLREGQSLVYGPDRPWGAQEPIRAGEADAWTQGELVFENRPLSEVVAELGRYHTGYIRVIGQNVRDRRVSGVFSIADPVGAVARLQRSLGLRAVHITDKLILIFV